MLGVFAPCFRVGEGQGQFGSGAAGTVDGDGAHSLIIGVDGEQAENLLCSPDRKAGGAPVSSLMNLCENAFDKGVARGGNNNEIMPADYDRLSGSTARNGGFTRVRIEKV